MSSWEHFFEIVKDWSLYIPITLPFKGVLWDVADASQVSCYALDTVGLCLSNCRQSRCTSHPRKPARFSSHRGVYQAGFSSLTFEGWPPLIFVNLTSNLKVRNRAIRHHYWNLVSGNKK